MVAEDAECRKKIEWRENSLCRSINGYLPLFSRVSCLIFCKISNMLAYPFPNSYPIAFPLLFACHFMYLGCARRTVRITGLRRVFHFPCRFPCSRFYILCIYKYIYISRILGPDFKILFVGALPHNPSIHSKYSLHLIARIF